MESLRQINESTEFFGEITKAELSTLSPELLPMWTAENNACFPHFLNYANDEFPGLLFDAQNGDINSINYIALKYDEYRNNLEANLMDYAPQIYEQFIESVRSGDSDQSVQFMNEFVNGFTKIEDDDDD